MTNRSLKDLSINVNRESIGVNRERKYSECLKSERSVWETDQKMVRFSARFDFIRSGRSVRLDHPKTERSVWLQSVNQMSEIGAVWEWDNFGKHQNPNFRISDIYCIIN